MTSRRNVNLNKELANDWVGRVRKWKRQWVPVDDKPPPGKKPCMLMKWVQTEDRAHPGPSRHPHIVPVTDLSLVPGARVGPAPDATETAAGVLVADPTAAPPLLDPNMQQAATPAAPAAAAAAPADVALQPSAFAAAATTAPAAATAIDGQTLPAAPAAATASDLATAVAAAGLRPPTLSLEAAAAAAAAGLAGMPEPSPLTATVSGLSLGLGGLSQPTSSQQLMMSGLGRASAMPAASDYTAGTDSDALGRLPHGGAAVSDYTGDIDSMDVDGGLGGTMSQGTASMRHAAGDADMDEEDELDDGLGDEDDEDQEDDNDEDDEQDDEDDDDQQQQQPGDGLADDGLERGLAAAGDDEDDDDDDDDDGGVDDDDDNQDDDDDVDDDMPG